MTKKIAFGAALALVFVGIAATDVSAGCNPPKFIQSFNSTSGFYTYWQSSATDQSPALASKFINGSTDVSGSCQFLYWGANSGQVGVIGDFGQACATGACPGAGPGNTGNGVLTLIGQVGGDVFGATTTEAAGIFDYSLAGGAAGGTKPAGGIPRPRVTNSSRSGSNVVLALALDSAASSFDAASAATITGYNLLSKSASSDPGRLASSYDAALLATAPAAGGGAATAGASVDCSNLANDRWVVTQIVTTAGPLAGVSNATRIRCNAALANPSYKFVPKKPVVKSDQ